MAQRDPRQPAGFAVALRRDAERRLVAYRSIVETHLAILECDTEQRCTDGLRRRFQVVKFVGVAPRHYDAAVTDDEPGAAAGERVVARLLQTRLGHADFRVSRLWPFSAGIIRRVRHSAGRQHHPERAPERCQKPQRRRR
jgi:hypothetical protein